MPSTSELMNRSTAAAAQALGLHYASTGGVADLSFLRPLEGIQATAQKKQEDNTDPLKMATFESITSIASKALGLAPDAINSAITASAGVAK